MICCSCHCDTDKLQDYDDHDELCALDKFRCMELSCRWCDLIDCEGIPLNTPCYNHIDGLNKPSYKLAIKEVKPRPPRVEAFDPGDLDHEIDIPF